MPTSLPKKTKNGVPANALWVSNAAIQLFLIVTLFSSSSYLQLLYLATSMILIPYFFSTAYAFKLALTGESYENSPQLKTKDLIIATIAMLYSIWLVYAAGPEHYRSRRMPQVHWVYYKARKENNKIVFTNVEKIIFAVTVIGAILAAVGLFTGKLSL